MHLKNIHNKPYDFTALVAVHFPLKTFVFTNEHGTNTIDFADAKAVLALNKAILKKDYGLIDWNIPEGYLCPPIPGRADYIHHLADLLKRDTCNEPCKGLDIGVGANCIYPILGAQIYEWQMVGVDINENAVIAAKENVAANPQLKNKIDIRHQLDPANIFQGVIGDDEYFDFTLCNPPFHTSKEEAAKVNLRKLRKLGISKNVGINFGGQANELWCKGGEALFLKRMIKQSVAFAEQVGVFTSLVSKKEQLPKIEKQLAKLKASYHIIEMEQGHKKSRIVAWKF